MPALRPSSFLWRFLTPRKTLRRITASRKPKKRLHSGQPVVHGVSSALLAHHDEKLFHREKSMLKKEEEIRDEAILEVAREVMLAIRTAPKTRGVDKLSILLADGDEKEAIAAKMEEVFEQSGGKRPSFTRDAKNVVKSQAVLIIGVKTDPFGLNCNYCGYPTCAEKPAIVPCSFASIDLGIGAGVAASLLGQKHIDNRMMFCIGYAVLRMNWLGPEFTQCLGFPLSASGKNMYFDR
jgi:uncharacterized ferredoxin-like protein